MDRREFRANLLHHDMKQSVFARCLGVSEETVSRWANGHQDIPKYAEAYLELLDKQKLYQETLHNLANSMIEEYERLRNG